jgi:ABC-type dipeptide/oligopeptide/nickel transport system permease subunit
MAFESGARRIRHVHLRTTTAHVADAGVHRGANAVAADEWDVVGRNCRSGLGGIDDRRGVASRAATLALALPIAAAFERLQSQSMSEAVRQPFLLAAIARGVPRREIIWRHAWRVSIRPICGVYGLVIGSLLSGSFIVEFVTAWPGIGRLMYEALRARDIYLVSACAAAGAGFLAFGTLLGDLLLAAADPRVREDIEA